MPTGDIVPQPVYKQDPHTNSFPTLLGGGIYQEYWYINCVGMNWDRDLPVHRPCLMRTQKGVTGLKKVAKNDKSIMKGRAGLFVGRGGRE